MMFGCLIDRPGYWLFDMIKEKYLRLQASGHAGRALHYKHVGLSIASKLR